MESLLILVCWLPPLAICLALACMVLVRSRPYATMLFFLPICAGLGFLVSVFPPFAPTLWLRMGLKGAGAVAGGAGWLAGMIVALASGVWLGVLLSRVAQQGLRGRSVPAMLALMVATTILIVPVFYLPHALFNEMFAGGSGYGYGTPKFLLKLITRTYFPLFSSLQGNGPSFNSVLYVACGVVTIGQVALIVDCVRRKCRTTGGTRRR